MSDSRGMRSLRVFAVVVCLAALVVVNSAHGQVKIDTPVKNSVVAAPSLLVTGTVVSSRRNIGVTVNDVAAFVNLAHAGTKNDPFRWTAVLDAPAGPVKLKARLHRGDQAGQADDGDTGAAVVHVDFAPVTNTLVLEPATASGVTPLDVTFSARFDRPDEVARFEIDYDGDGTWDETAASIPENLVMRYATPGIRLATARVTREDGTVSTATNVIHAQRYQVENALVKEVWSGFRRSLATGNVDAVMPWFAADSVREKYRRPLETIQATLPAFAEAIASIDAIWIRAGMAHYLGTRLENGRTMGYHVYFARDAKGLWKVLQF
jgi:hypothetical protein